MHVLVLVVFTFLLVDILVGIFAAQVLRGLGGGACEAGAEGGGFPRGRLFGAGVEGGNG